MNRVTQVILTGLVLPFGLCMLPANGHRACASGSGRIADVVLISGEVLLTQAYNPHDRKLIETTVLLPVSSSRWLELELRKGENAIIWCSEKKLDNIGAVMLLDERNFSRWKSGLDYQYVRKYSAVKNMVFLVMPITTPAKYFLVVTNEADTSYAKVSVKGDAFAEFGKDTYLEMSPPLVARFLVRPSATREDITSFIRRSHWCLGAFRCKTADPIDMEIIDGSGRVVKAFRGLKRGIFKFRAKGGEYQFRLTNKSESRAFVGLVVLGWKEEVSKEDLEELEEFFELEP
ncbi:hypothetical protein E3J62_08135 [candidate division TA06 bacterium]|uniref:Uncharacterized protein n=1 Tax=candidate division TA06 bacterium TaxID=2250710 RepID=A0A523URV2_UNCT6|nr:MAG: hypothetical protein E3J62_08135 [candidate division TA06 bacterium]